jgi:hypothetical protein
MQLVRMLFLMQLIFMTPSQALILNSPLLQRINLVENKSEVYSLDITNNEEEDLICEIEYGYLIMQENGNVIVKQAVGDKNFPIQGPSLTEPIPKGKQVKTPITIRKSSNQKVPPTIQVGMLVRKHRKPVPSNPLRKDEAVSAGIITIQQYLIQFLVQNSRTSIGLYEVSNLKIQPGSIEFDIENPTEQDGEPEVTFFLTKNNQPIAEPIKKKMRIFPHTKRHYTVPLEEKDISSCQLFIDDPLFEMVQKEIN